MPTRQTFRRQRMYRCNATCATLFSPPIPVANPVGKRSKRGESAAAADPAAPNAGGAEGEAVNGARPEQGTMDLD